MNNLHYLPKEPASNVFPLHAFFMHPTGLAVDPHTDLSPRICYCGNRSAYIVLANGNLVIETMLTGEGWIPLNAWYGISSWHYDATTETHNDESGLVALVNYVMTLANHTNPKDYTAMAVHDIPTENPWVTISHDVKKNADGITLTIFETNPNKPDENGDPEWHIAHQYSFTNPNSGLLYTYNQVTQNRGVTKRCQLSGVAGYHPAVELLKAALTTWF